MLAIFRDRRLKNGVFTLMFACVLMGGWLRSNFRSDEVMIEAQYGGPDQWLYFYRSSDNAIRLICRFESGKISQEEELLVVHYWAIVVPLTLLSTYLILWKPRRNSPG